jgi:hypothetical protein
VPVAVAVLGPRTDARSALVFRMWRRYAMRRERCGRADSSSDSDAKRHTSQRFSSCTARRREEESNALNGCALTDSGTQSDSQIDRQTDTQTDRQTGRQTGRQTDRQPDRQSDRQRDRETDRQRDTHKKRKHQQTSMKQLIGSLRSSEGKINIVAATAVAASEAPLDAGAGGGADEADERSAVPSCCFCWRRSWRAFSGLLKFKSPAICPRSRAALFMLPRIANGERAADLCLFGPERAVYNKQA